MSGELNADFRSCLNEIVNNGIISYPRGTITKEILNYSFSISNPRNRIITFPERKISYKYLLGEFIWYLTGSNNVQDILSYSKFWNNLQNTGKIPNYEAGTINSNYGNRIFGYSKLPAFSGYNQWNNTLELLKRDKDTRQAVLNIHVPSDRHEGNLDVCCTLSLQFLIRENKLHLIINMRSQDIITGFCNDFFQFSMLQECMQVQLKKIYPELELGTCYNNVASLHLYEKHFEMAEKILQNDELFEVTMDKMDDFNDSIMIDLSLAEQSWRNSGMSKEFDFKGCNFITPYWQNVLKQFFK